MFMVEDHTAFWKDLARQINSDRCQAVCSSVRRVPETLETLERFKPSLGLLDVTTLPVKNGLQLMKDVRAKDRAMKLLIVSKQDEAEYAARVLRLGADGYIMKQEGPQQLLRAMLDVLNGHLYLSEKVITSVTKA